MRGKVVRFFILTVGVIGIAVSTATPQEIPKNLLQMLGTEEGQAILDSLIKAKQAEQLPQVTPQIQVPTAPPETLPRAPVRSPIERAFEPETLLTVDRKLSQFGYEVFSDTLILATQPWQAIGPLKVGPEYVLGPGDEIVVTAWGKLDETFTYTLDRDGKITLPKTGPLYLWGKTLGEAQRLIKDRLHQAFSGVNFSVSLGRLRSVPIFVLGEVRAPGVYAFQPLVTPLQVLFRASGVKKSGSLRRVKVLRTTGNTEIVDLYDLLIHGKRPEALYLNPGDMVFVPSIGPVVGVAGAVKRPAIYELKDEKTLKDVIALAGGLLFEDAGQHIQIERMVDQERKIVWDQTFTSLREFQKAAAQVKIQDGDLVLVLPVLPERRGIVTIQGNVFRPGDYALNEAPTIRDLIQAASGIKPGTYLDRAELHRVQKGGIPQLISVNLRAVLSGDEDANLALQEWDTLWIFTTEEAVVYDSIQVEGAVYRPGKYRYYDGMTLGDALFKAGGTRPTAYLQSIEVYRSQPGKPREILTIDFTKEEGWKTPLRPGDWILVKEVRDRLREATVMITGEVQIPGSYPITEGETIGDLIRRAGGLTANADPRGVFFFRKSAKELMTEATRRFITQLYTDLLKEEARVSQMDLPTEERTYKLDYIQRRKKFLIYLTQRPDTTLVLSDSVPVQVLFPEMEKERVVIDLTDSLMWKLPLEPGDSLYIPPRLSTVQIVGAVMNPVTVAYREGADLSYYLEMAGGLREYADKKHIYVIKASGRAERPPKKIDPGDTILVPERYEPRTPLRIVLRDVATIVYQAILAFVTIRSLTR